jgi:hypothetical protein
MQIRIRNTVSNKGEFLIRDETFRGRVYSVLTALILGVGHEGLLHGLRGQHPVLLLSGDGRGRGHHLHKRDIRPLAKLSPPTNV